MSSMQSDGNTDNSSFVEVQLRIANIVDTQTDGIFPSALALQYQQRYGVALNPTIFGFSDLIDMLHAMPSAAHVVPLVANPNTVSRLASFRIYPVKDFQKLRSRLRQVLKQLRQTDITSADAIPLHDFVLAYEQIIGAPLNATTYGRLSVMDLLRDLDECARLEVKFSNDGARVESCIIPLTSIERV